MAEQTRGTRTTEKVITTLPPVTTTPAEKVAKAPLGIPEGKLPTDIIHTPSGDITRAEHEALKAGLAPGVGIKATEVKRVIRERKKREEPLPSPEVIATKTDIEVVERQPMRPFGELKPYTPPPEAEGSTKWQDYVPRTMRGFTSGAGASQILATLRSANAPITVQQAFISRHELRRRVSPATRELVSRTNRDIIDYNKLKDETQFNQAKVLGFIPKSAEYVAPLEKGGQWGHITQAQVTTYLDDLVKANVMEQGIADVALRQPAGRRLPFIESHLEDVEKIRVKLTTEQLKKTKAFETELKEKLPNLYKVYDKEGYNAYLKAFGDRYIRLRKGKWIDRTEFNKLDAKYKTVGVKKGFDAMLSSIEADNNRMTAIISTMDKDYEIDGGYNLPLALKNKAVTTEDLEFVGFKEKDIDSAESAVKASEETGVALLGARTWQDVTKPNVVFTDEERQKIIEKTPRKRDDFALSPESGKRLGIQIASFIAPATRAALPEYTIKDITAIEWGLTGVNVALIATAFAPGAIMGSLAGKTVVTGVATTGAGLIGYHTVKNWADLSSLQRAIGVGGTVLYSLPMLVTVARGIKISGVKVPVVKGQAVAPPAWKGLSVFKNPIIGRSSGKWVVGARNITLPEARLIMEGYKPEMMLDTKIFVNPPALTKAGFTPTQIKYLTDSLKVRNLFAGKKSPYLSKDVLLEPTAYISKDEMAIFLKQIGKYNTKIKNVDMIYGGGTIKAQLAPELRGWRQMHDLDMHTTFKLDEAKAFVNETMALFKKLPSKSQYRISPKSPIRIEKLVKGKWQHMNDLKSEFIDPSLQISEVAVSKLDATGAYSYGRMVAEPAITVKYPGVGKIDIMALSESGVRKADTILRVRQIKGRGVTSSTEVADELARYPESITSKISKVVSTKSYKNVSFSRDTGVLRLVTTDAKTLPSQIAHELAHIHYQTPRVYNKFDAFMRGKIRPKSADELYAEAFEEVVTGKPMKLTPELEAQYIHPPRNLINNAIEFIRQEGLGIKPRGVAKGIVSGAETAFRPPQRGIARPGVPKDAADFYVILQTYEKGGILKAGVADDWLKSWAKSMGYTEAELVKLFPNLQKAVLEVAGNTPSNLIGYRFTPASSAKVSPGASPTISIQVPSSLGASVSGILASQISKPVSLYALSPSVRASISSTVSEVVPSGYPTMVGTSAMKGLSPSGIASISAAKQRVSPEVSPSPAPKVSPKASPIPSPVVVPSVVPSMVSITPVTPITTPSPLVSPPISPVTSPEIVPSPEPVPKKPPPPFIIPTRAEAIKERRRQVSLPQGTIAYKMGAFWKYLPPPWTQRRILTLPIGVIPMGAINIGLRTPKETIQMIGKADAEVPQSISADMGITDVEIFNYGKDIRFSGRGTLSNVGERIESTTIGMSIPSRFGGEYGLSSVYREERKKPFRRPEAKKKGRSRKGGETGFEDVVSLQGMRY